MMKKTNQVESSPVPNKTAATAATLPLEIASIPSVSATSVGEFVAAIDASRSSSAPGSSSPSPRR
jgi:hypothetical protein